MGLIEKAAKRLEELRRVGFEIPDDEVSVAAPPPRARESEPARSARVDLDLRRLALQGFVTPGAPQSQIAEEFRVIKRPLLANARGQGERAVRHGNLIMVTSAVPREGKTFASINLAMSIAMELDRTVMLVDADVARPSIPRTLDLPPMPGMLDVLLRNGVEMQDAVVRTNVEKLTFLSCGRPHPRAAEMLASEAMSGFVDELASRYPDRVIIFDSPPLLVTTEARVLASRMGQIVFLVRADSTLQSEVKRALVTIESCPVKMMVLNGARTRTQGAYGYGYGYGYGHGQDN